jgi:hypothetical protein
MECLLFDLKSFGIRHAARLCAFERSVDREYVGGCDVPVSILLRRARCAVE